MYLETALAKACLKGHIDVVAFFLQLDIVSVSSNALSNAASRGYEDIVDLLIRSRRLRTNAISANNYRTLAV